jgi:hypothetical protein
MIPSGAVFQIAGQDLERSNTGHAVPHSPFSSLCRLTPRVNVPEKKPCAPRRIPCYSLCLGSAPQSLDQDYLLETILICICLSWAQLPAKQFLSFSRKRELLRSISSVYWIPACAGMTFVCGRAIPPEATLIWRTPS